VFTLAALADGVSLIKDPLESDDTLATIRVLKDLGVNFERGGPNIKVTGGELSRPSSELDCGDSGTTMRFMCSIASLVDGDTVLIGNPSLQARPLLPLLNALEQLGVKSTSNMGFPPVTIHGKGELHGGEVDIKGDVSSQFISSLLLASPLACSPLKIRVTTRLESKPYVQMTVDTMKSFGVNVQSTEDLRLLEPQHGRYMATDIQVEGDWSSAAYILAAGVLNGEVTVENINIESSQADRAIMDILSRMGVELRFISNGIKVRESSLLPINFDLSNCPDLFPIVSALCTQAEGKSRLSGLSRLHIKESDRVKSMTDGLRKMGAQVKADYDVVEIVGTKLRGATVNPCNDHRIAMSFAVLSLVADGSTTIMDANCVSKSYPEFWAHISGLGAKTRRINHG